MILERITTINNSDLELLLPLYVDAFPDSERRNLEQLKKLISHCDNMYFNAIKNNNSLCGFYIYWKLDGFYYMEHLAIFENFRNMSIGSKVLEWIEKNLNGTRILEVEEPLDEITTRRVNLYKRNGYEVVDKSYMQPSYTTAGIEYPLWIMSNNDSENIKKYIEIIKQDIYIDKFKYNVSR